MTIQSNAFFNLDAAPLSVDSVTLTTRNLNKVVSFYQRYLGLKVHSETKKGVTLGAGAPFLTVTSNPDARPADPRAPGLFHVAFLLPDRADLSSWLAHVVREGLSPWGASDHDVSEAVYLDDPEGNGIEVYTDRPASQWKTRNGQLYIPSHRLDYSALPVAGIWNGAPAQTRIGHVHLQTTKIPEAEEFWAGLGMDVMARYPGGSFFGSGGYHHNIAANVWSSHSRPVQPGPKTGLTNITLATAPNLTSQTITHIAPSGVEVTLQPKRN